MSEIVLRKIWQLVWDLCIVYPIIGDLMFFQMESQLVCSVEGEEEVERQVVMVGKQTVRFGLDDGGIRGRGTRGLAGKTGENIASF